MEKKVIAKDKEHLKQLINETIQKEVSNCDPKMQIQKGQIRPQIMLLTIKCDFREIFVAFGAVPEILE